MSKPENIDEDLVERYELIEERIACITEETTVNETYREFFSLTAKYLMFANSILDLVLEDEYRTKNIDELKAINDKNFDEIREASYETSYTNPEYAVAKCGDIYGKYLCELLTKLRTTFGYALQGRIEELVVMEELFVEIYNIFESEELSEEAIKDAVYWFESDYQDLFFDYQIRAIVDDSMDFYKNIVLDSDLEDF